MPLLPKAALSAAILVLVHAAALASTAPATPEFALAWGAFGSGPGQFSAPYSVATDALGDVYVVDQNHHRIQKFDRLGKFLLQWGWIGVGNGQFFYPAAVATDASGDVYVADNGNHRVQKFSSSGAYLTQWGTYGSGDGEMSSPSGIATDGAGNVYVSDTFNRRIQKFTSSGTFLTKWGSAGTDNGQFAYPFGIGTDPSGNVYVADGSNHRIQKFTSTGAYVTQWGSIGASAGYFNLPLDVKCDGAGNVYVVEQNNHRVQKFTATGTYLTQWGTNGTGDGQFFNPAGLALDAAANIYVADQTNNRMQKFSSAGPVAAAPMPAYLLKWNAVSSGADLLSQPKDVTLDAAGNVYVADQNRISLFSPSGAFITTWGSAGSGDGQFSFPYGVASGGGYLYVLDTGNGRVQRFDAGHAFAGKWGSPGSGPGQFSTALGLACDAGGNVYVADTFNDRIQKFTATGTFLLQWGTEGSESWQLNNPTRVAIDRFGDVYVLDSGNCRVMKFSSSGTYLGQWGSFGSGPGQFGGSNGLAIDTYGYIYVSDSYGRVQKFTSTGVFVGQWGSTGSGNGQLSDPYGVAVDSGGSVYVANNSNNRIEKYQTAPAIALISDVRNDQGRQAQIRFLRGSGDDPDAVPSPVVTGYEIYRRNDVLPEASAMSGGAGPSTQLAGWTYVASVPAHGESEYSVVVPTLVDATASSLEYSAYMVRATTANLFTFNDSAVENGFSIDNLAPPTPTPFLAAYTGGATHLHWGVNAAADFATFRLYRGADAAFAPGPGSFVAATPDTGHVDAGAAGGWYKLTAVDVNGNESPFALLGPSQTTDVAPGPTMRFALEGVRPNPSPAGRVLVSFALPSDAPATIELFDLAGRRVAERAVGSLGPGSHLVDLAAGRRLPAGIYLVRLTRGAQRLTARAAVVE